ncbi:MAG: hypothetical protein CVT89_05450 [Candidatus Altiarchaeales archaeon HGW-Altiarchaeales-2]|nr:MAG: hypothetical protein CVT89_05450 [Candidatus Altiarchaeales archaeon HGW-Altiarchaeales-2]
MAKLIFDSDGLIKLTKSGVIEVILVKFECFISEEVCKESVIDGMDRLYEDAFLIDSFIERKLLTVKKFNEDENAKNIMKETKSIGMGERSTLHLFFNLGASAIVSDDYTFLKLLPKNKIPFIIPTDLIAELAVLNILTKESALSALEKIKPWVKENNYQTSKRYLENINKNK